MRLIKSERFNRMSIDFYNLSQFDENNEINYAIDDVKSNLKKDES